MSQLTLNLPEDIEQLIANVSKDENMTKEETITRAFALLSVAAKARKEGNSLGVVREDSESHNYEVVARVVGVFNE